MLFLVNYMNKTYLLLGVVLLLIGGMLVPVGKSANSKEEEVRGVFISYIEISEYLLDKGEEESKKAVLDMIEHVREIHCNTIILQVRPSSDAIYPSSIFPISTYLSSTGRYPYDVLDYFIQECHKRGLRLFAWINPYRIQTNANKDLISKTHPAYPYLNSDMVFEKDGLFYNPSKQEVEDFIVDGVLEVLQYDVDGVLFDDYFYPDSNIDLFDYEEYLKSHDYLSLDDYHLMIINQMIHRVHDVCSREGIAFGVSPEGNIQNNYEKNYADVKRWLREDGYVDFIMPQIYYGFENSIKPFIDTALEWQDFIQNNVSLYIALAFYKVGKFDLYAKEGKEEWIHHSDMIMREIIVSRNLKYYQGFSLFRYDNIFDSSQFTNNSQEEVNNFKKIVK